MTTVYWAGGEEISFVGATLADTAAAYNCYRSNFSRGSLCTYGNAFSNPSTSFPVALYATTPQFGPISQFWVHGQYGVNNSQNNTQSNGIWLSINDSGGLPRIAIRGTGTAGQLKISTVNTAGTITDLVTSASGVINFNSPNTLPCALDIFVSYSNSGQITVYWNGVNVCDTGPGVNVTTNGVTTLGQVTFSIYTTQNSLGSYQGWSECIIQDTTTLGMALFTLPPLAAGNTQAWTGAVGNINELAVNNTNFNYTTTANLLSEWTVATTLPSGTWQINAVTQSASVLCGTTGPQHFGWVVRTSAGADFVQGTIALSVGYAFYQNVWGTNPSTSVLWNAGELINSGIKSLA